VERSKDLSNWIGEQIDDISLNATRSNRLAAAAFHIALTHHSSVVALVEQGRHVSGFALIRPEIDAYIRGLWLGFLASDEEIERITKADRAPSTPELMDRLEKAGYFDAKALTSMVPTMWPVVCDFTHTGIRALVRHLTPTSIEPLFEDEEIVEALGSADAWALMAATGIAGLAGDDSLSLRLLEKCRVCSTGG